MRETSEPRTQTPGRAPCGRPLEGQRAPGLPRSGALPHDPALPIQAPRPRPADVGGAAGAQGGASPLGLPQAPPLAAKSGLGGEPQACLEALASERAPSPTPRSSSPASASTPCVNPRSSPSASGSNTTTYDPMDFFSSTHPTPLHSRRRTLDDGSSTTTDISTGPTFGCLTRHRRH